MHRTDLGGEDRNGLAGAEPDEIGARLGEGQRLPRRRKSRPVERASRQVASLQSKVAKVEYHPALSYREIANFMAALRKVPGAKARALELTILTGGRTADVVKAELSHPTLTIACGRSRRTWRQRPAANFGCR